jgi:hypothetical protein
MRYHYFAVRPPSMKNHIRIEKAVGPRVAILLAFGRGCDNFEYKDLGTRSPAYWSNKARQEYLSDKDWKTVQPHKVRLEDI